MKKPALTWDHLLIKAHECQSAFPLMWYLPATNHIALKRKSWGDFIAHLSKKPSSTQNFLEILQKFAKHSKGIFFLLIEQ